MTETAICPSEDRLLGMLDCKLEQVRQTEVIEHVNDCPTCQNRLDTLIIHGLRDDLQFEHCGTHLREGNIELTKVLSTDEVGQMTRSIMSGNTRVDLTVSLDFLDASDDPALLGRLGQYEISEVIGRGGMGIVLKAHDTRLNRIVAIKVLAPELASNPTARRRFLREAKSAAAVSHDHVVTVHAVEPGGLPYLAMEYIDGWSLQQKIDREGPLPIDQVLRVATQAAQGLSAAHEQGLIHHDIKPANILLQNGVERVQITDFGLARAVDDVTITRTGEVRGTPQYMSPEQAQGKTTDPRSDLFSLGAVLYAMCTGRVPFRADSTMGVLHRVCNDAPRPIREVNPDIPDWLVVIIDRLLEKSPDKRFQSASEVAGLLGQYLAHLQQPTRVPLPTSVIPPNRSQPLRLNRWSTGALVALVLFGTLGLGEVSGVTNIAGTVVRIAMGEGTLVVEIDDPNVQVSIDGEELIISGAGFQELKLKPGQYRLEAFRDGESVKQELVTITRGDRKLVSVSKELTAGKNYVQSSPLPFTSIPEATITRIRSLGGPSSTWVHASEFWDEGRRLICGRASGYIEFWDLESGTVERLLGGSTIDVSPNGDLLASGNFNDGEVSIWKIRDRSLVRKCEIGPDVVRVKFSPDQKLLLAKCSSGSNSAVVLDWEAGTELRRFGRGGYSRIATFSPDGQTVLVGGLFLCLYDLETGKELWHVNSIGNPEVGIFSPSGDWIITQSDSEIVLRSAESGQEIGRFLGHNGRVRCVRFLPDGRHFVSGSEDRTFRIWNVHDRSEVARVTTEDHSTVRLAVSPDGRLLASGGGKYLEDGTPKLDERFPIHLWQLPESLWPNVDAANGNAPARELDESAGKESSGKVQSQQPTDMDS